MASDPDQVGVNEWRVASEEDFDRSADNAVGCGGVEEVKEVKEVEEVKEVALVERSTKYRLHLVIVLERVRKRLKENEMRELRAEFDGKRVCNAMKTKGIDCLLLAQGTGIGVLAFWAELRRELRAGIMGNDSAQRDNYKV